MQESVYHGVPVIGIPMGIDQDTNVHNAVLQGYALKLDLKQMNEETLTAAIKMILNDSRYSYSQWIMFNLQSTSYILLAIKLFFATTAFQKVCIESQKPFANVNHHLFKLQCFGQSTFSAQLRTMLPISFNLHQEN